MLSSFLQITYKVNPWLKPREGPILSVLCKFICWWISCIWYCCTVGILDLVHNVFPSCHIFTSIICCFFTCIWLCSMMTANRSSDILWASQMLTFQILVRYMWWWALPFVRMFERLFSWPSNAMWWHNPGSTLALVIGCCPTTISHYLNLCWLFIK